MTSDVVLSAALRANLLSLQNTQGLMDITQNRLATGRKINSALDGPQAFFASQSLTNRAGDLSRLLDSIGQSIQVIKAADNGITALTKLVEQADSIVTSAREVIAKAQSEAKAVGDQNLKNIDDLTALTGWPAGSAIIVTLTQENGITRQIDTFGAGSLGASETINIAASTSTDELITQLNSIVDIDNNHVLNASLDDKGQLVIKTTNGDNFSMEFTTTANTDVANLGLASALGFGKTVRVVPDGAGNNNVTFTSIADTALRSFALYDSTPTPDEIAQRSDLLSTLVNSAGTALFAGLGHVNDDYTIAINGGAAQTINLTDAGGNPVSLQNFIDQINSNGSLNNKIRAEFDEETGVMSIIAIDASVTSITTGVTSVGGGGATANFGFGTSTLVATNVNPMAEHISLGAASATLAKLEKDYDSLRNQIDLLVQDTGYRGTNLLNGDELLTIFNEDRDSSLTTVGVTFTADGLGLNQANFSRIATVEAHIDEVREALDAVRNFGDTIANDLSIIQTREVFTKEMINTLTEGSDKLVNADQNEEGAKLLALQTRQQLGITSLSLASQSQQAVLRLFG